MMYNRPMSKLQKTYAVLGTGAIGGYCAAKLNQAGFDVHCLLRSDFDYVKKSGLAILTDQGKITTHVHAYQQIDELPKCDVVLVALKTTQNHLLKTMLPKVMHDNSVVVLLQNGIGAEQEIAQFIEASKIIGATCSLKVSKIAPGVIRHFNENNVRFAQYYTNSQHEEISTVSKQLAEDFNRAEIKSSALAHLITMRW